MSVGSARGRRRILFQYYPLNPPIFPDVFILMKYSYFYFTARGRRCQGDPLEGDGGFYSNTLPFTPAPKYFRIYFIDEVFVLLFHR